MSLPQRVLAVDDNALNLKIVLKTLGGEYQVATATSGEEALQIAARYRPDLILLDIMMSGIDGYETCRRLRGLSQLANCKIILVSARGSTADRLEGYAAGANDYLIKPFDSEELLAKIRVYLRLKSVEEVDRLKSDLLSMLSHETRTPLTGILSPTALLLEDPDLNDAQREFVKMIRVGGERLLSLVEKVAFLSQLKAGLAPSAPQLLEVEGLCARAIAIVQSRSKRDDVAIELHCGTTAMVEGDRDQLQYALEAILDNAVRVSPRSASVSVDVTVSGPWTVVEITDHGPGIAPAFLEHVFDEFAVQNIRNHSQGHGLSLATARLIVDQHGGNLVAENVQRGGAMFRMMLPTEGIGENAA